MAAIFQFPSRTVAEVSMHNLVKNLHTLRNFCRKEIIAVVKADAYGHGMISVAKALVMRGSCLTLAVATLEEAIELRKKLPHGVTILVLSGFFPHQLDAFHKYRLIPVIHNLNHLKSLAGRKHLPEIHLKIDTGMHRLGVALDEVPEAIKTLEKIEIKLAGLATHLAESEVVVSDFSDFQLKAFEQVYWQLRERKLLHTDAKIHVPNSGGILRDKLGVSNAVRPGLALYGVSPNPRLTGSSQLVPVLEWKSRILSLREVRRGDTVGYNRTYTVKKKERLAIVPVGYADGYPRMLSGRGEVLVHGKRCPVRGRVSMDMISVDVTHVSGVKEGSPVILIGKGARDAITAWDVAGWAETIPYEIFCGISMRVPRLYLDNKAGFF